MSKNVSCRLRYSLSEVNYAEHVGCWFMNTPFDDAVSEKSHSKSITIQ